MPRAYRAGVGVVLVTCFLVVWTTVVRDDGSGIGWFMLITAAGVGAAAAGLRAAGMARAMTGVAVMQVALGALTATAPSTAALPGGVARVLLWCGVFTMLWLVSAVLFRAAAKTRD